MLPIKHGPQLFQGHWWARTQAGLASLPLPFPSSRRRGREARSVHATRVPSSSKFGAAAAPHAEFGTDHPSRSKSAPEKRDSGVPSRARARIPGIRSATFWPQRDADHRGPARPSSAPLGSLRHPSVPLGSPPLSSYPHALLTWGVGGSALRALSPRCGRREPIEKRSGWAPQSRLSRPLFVSGARRAPLGSQGLRAPPPRSRGASPGKGRGGVRGRSLRGGARKLAELDQGA